MSIVEPLFDKGLDEPFNLRIIFWGSRLREVSCYVSFLAGMIEVFHEL